jgi:hypothetical protein
LTPIRPRPRTRPRNTQGHTPSPAGHIPTPSDTPLNGAPAPLEHRRGPPADGIASQAARQPPTRPRDPAAGPTTPAGPRAATGRPQHLIRQTEGIPWSLPGHGLRHLDLRGDRRVPPAITDQTTYWDYYTEGVADRPRQSPQERLRLDPVPRPQPAPRDDLELGSGQGDAVQPLAAKGVTAIGLDISPALREGSDQLGPPLQGTL